MRCRERRRFLRSVLARARSSPTLTRPASGSTANARPARRPSRTTRSYATRRSPRRDPHFLPASAAPSRRPGSARERRRRSGAVRRVHGAEHAKDVVQSALLSFVSPSSSVCIPALESSAVCDRSLEGEERASTLRQGPTPRSHAWHRKRRPRVVHERPARWVRSGRTARRAAARTGVERRERVLAPPGTRHTPAGRTRREGSEKREGPPHRPCEPRSRPTASARRPPWPTRRHETRRAHFGSRSPLVAARHPTACARAAAAAHAP